MRTIALEEHFLASGYREVMRRNAAREEHGWQPPATVTAERLGELAELGAARLEDMDANGIDMQALSDVGQIVAPHARSEAVPLARASNDLLAATIAAHPNRFAGFATLPMVEPAAAAEELDRAVRALGLRGAMIHGMTDGRFLDDPAFLPVLERAAALAVPIYLHPALPPAPVRETYYSNLDPAVASVLSASAWGWHSEVGMHALRLILAGVFDRLPTLQIIIGHMGEMLPFMLARVTDQLTFVPTRLQRSAPEYVAQNFYLTTSGFFTDPPLLLAMQIVGADRILFAVDYPFSANAQGRAFLERAAISARDKEKISHLNAERLLRLEQAR